MESLIPGIDVRNRVSWMACQSSWETRTAEFLLPVICMAIWESATSSRRPYNDFRASVAVSVVMSCFLSYAISYVILLDQSSRPERVCAKYFARLGWAFLDLLDEVFEVFEFVCLVFNE
jgi:hypothetical protein